MAAPAALTAEFRKVHQFNVFTVNTPMQHALAGYLADPAPYLELSRVLPAPSATCSAPAWRRRGCALLPSEGTLLPVRRLQRRQRSRRGGVLPLADGRDRRCGDPAVGVLRRRLRAAHRAAVFRQARRDAARWRSIAWRRSSDWRATCRRRRVVGPEIVFRCRRSPIVESSVSSARDVGRRPHGRCRPWRRVLRSRSSASGSPSLNSGRSTIGALGRQPRAPNGRRSAAARRRRAGTAQPSAWCRSRAIWYRNSTSW